MLLMIYWPGAHAASAAHDNNLFDLCCVDP